MLPVDERSTAPFHPYIEQDLRDAVSIPLEDWLHGALRLPKDRLNTWASKIGEMRWFEDEDVLQYLREYCSADKDNLWLHHRAFKQLANEVLDLACGNLPGIRTTGSYPIDDIVFTDTQSRGIGENPEHQQLTAVRRPAVLATRGPVAAQFLETGDMQWTDVLFWWEIQYGGSLKDALEQEKVSRGIKPPGTDKSGRTKKTSSKHSATSRKSQTAAEVGTKRSRADDLLAGDSIDPKMMKHMQSQDSDFDLYAGKNAALRSASYALELLSCTRGTRVSCHGAVLKGDKVSLWYYDASGIVYTNQQLSLLSDFEKVAAIIVAFACCPPEHPGALPTSIVKPPTPYLKSYPPQSLSGHVLYVRNPSSGKRTRLTLKESLYSQRVLVGRRTFAYAVDASPVVPNTNLIAKFAYQVNARRAEHELVSVAREAAVDHLPHVHMWADIWRMSQGVRRVFFGRSEEKRYEDRTLRVIVYTRYLSIKPLFTKRCELIPVMVEQMLDCLHDLRYKANMLHRDVSVNNIMYEMQGGKYHFILIDFDMAVVLPQNACASPMPSSKHRTGTLPFMARELIEDAWRASVDENWLGIRHLLRHDLESLFWVSLWCVCVLLTENLGWEKEAALLGEVRRWESPNLQEVADRKLMLCLQGLRCCYIMLPEPAACLAPWFDGWMTVFSAAFDKTRSLFEGSENGLTEEAEPVDEETLGGTISRDVLYQVLHPLMPCTQEESSDDEKVLTAPEDVVTDKVEESGDKEDVLSAPQGVIAEKKQDTLVRPKAKPQPRKKALSAEQTAVRASVLSKLRPRKEAA